MRDAKLASETEQVQKSIILERRQQHQRKRVVANKRSLKETNLIA